MNVRQWVSMLLLAVALPVAAQIRTVALAHEVRLADLRMPESTAGTLGFKPCRECDFQTTRISADCAWLVNEQSMSFEEFQQAVSALGDRAARYVTVVHHLENDVITEVSIVVR